MALKESRVSMELTTLVPMELREPEWKRGFPFRSRLPWVTPISVYLDQAREMLSRRIIEVAPCLS
jgi:hypothetical protein